jgi:uncharacterized RDD family membrane protein YckC
MPPTPQHSSQQDLLNISEFNAETAYAGFWLRLAAYIIDGIILYIPNTIVSTIIGIGNIYNYNTGFEPTAILINLLLLLYFPIMESSEIQGTLGKKLVDIKVTDMDGQRISFLRAIGRYFAKILSAMILFIGFIMAGFTEKKQALHDILAGTLVVKR